MCLTNKHSLKALAAFFCFLALCVMNPVSIANATTLMSGDLTASSHGGVWKQYGNKFYLFNDIKNTQGKDKMAIDSLDALAAFITGGDTPTHIVLGGMGTANKNPGALTAADFSVYHNNNLLLSATLGNNSGTLSYVSALGYPANFDFLSNLTVTGGSWYNAGLVTGLINVAVNGNYGYLSNAKDLHFSDISFKVGYTPGSTAVPEPMSLSLLASGLLAGAIKSKRKANSEN